MFTEEKWIEGIFSLPLYLVTAVVIGNRFNSNGLVWLILVIVILSLISFIYHHAVTQRVKNGLKSSTVLCQWLVGQLLFIGGVWFVSNQLFHAVT